MYFCINRNHARALNMTSGQGKQGKQGKKNTFKLEGEVTSLSESTQGEVEDNREKLMVLNRNIH